MGPVKSKLKTLHLEQIKYLCFKTSGTETKVVCFHSKFIGSSSSVSNDRHHSPIVNSLSAFGDNCLLVTLCPYFVNIRSSPPVFTMQSPEHNKAPTPMGSNLADLIQFARILFYMLGPQLHPPETFGSLFVNEP